MSEKEASEKSDLRVEEEAGDNPGKVGLLTKTIPISFITPLAQERRNRLMGKITRSHYEMD